MDDAQAVTTVSWYLELAYPTHDGTRVHTTHGTTDVGPGGTRKGLLDHLRARVAAESPHIPQLRDGQVVAFTTNPRLR